MKIKSNRKGGIHIVQAPDVAVVVDLRVQILIIVIILVIVITIIGNVFGFNRGGTFLHGVHELEVDPGGVESRNGEGARALDLGAVALAELLHFVTALDGGFGRGGVGAAACDGVGDLLPVGGLEVAAAEGVPLVAVGVDEGEGFIGGPAGRGEAASGGGWGGEGDEGEGDGGGGIGRGRRRRGRGGGVVHGGMRMRARKRVRWWKWCLVT